MRDDDHPIDFSALGLSRDGRHQEQLVQRILARAVPPTPSPWLAVTRFTWPLLAAAAVLTAVAVSLVELPSPSLTADTLADWANAGDIPHGVDVVALTGDRQ